MVLLQEIISFVESHVSKQYLNNFQDYLEPIYRCFSSIWVSFTNIYESQDNRGSGRLSLKLLSTKFFILAFAIDVRYDGQQSN